MFSSIRFALAQDKAMRHTSTATMGDYIVDYDIYHIQQGDSPFNRYIYSHLLVDFFVLFICGFNMTVILVCVKPTTFFIHMLFLCVSYGA